MIRYGVIAVSAVALCLALPDSGFAQVEGVQSRPGFQQGREMTREEIIERAERMFTNQMARELRLTPEQSSALQEVFSAYEQPRREIASQKRRLLGEAHSSLDGARSDERAQVLLAEFASIREREANLLREEEERLLEVLSPSQVLALQLFREQFGDRIRGATHPFSPPSSLGPSGGATPFRAFPSR